jgi:hypothetical protein
MTTSRALRTLPGETLRSPRSSRALTPAAERAGRKERETTTENTVIRLQRAVGNGAVTALIGHRAGGDGSIARDTTSGIHASSEGRPLEPAVRESMEDRFGEAFGDVRVHVGPDADRAARSLGAHAYTVGRDIVFRYGTYSPGTGRGDRILAHELAHVVQQRSGPVDGQPIADGLIVSHPSDRFEREADRVADSVLTRCPAKGPLSPSFRSNASVQVPTAQRTKEPHRCDEDDRC